MRGDKGCTGGGCESSGDGDGSNCGGGNGGDMLRDGFLSAQVPVPVVQMQMQMWCNGACGSLSELMIRYIDWYGREVGSSSSSSQGGAGQGTHANVQVQANALVMSLGDGGARGNKKGRAKSGLMDLIRHAAGCGAIPKTP